MKNFAAILFLFALLPVLTGSRDTPPDDAEVRRAALLATDREWALAASSDDVELIVSYWTDDAVIHAPNFPVVAGKDALRDFIARNRSLPGFSMTWTPRTAVVSASDDVGYTLGSYEVVMPAPGGLPQTVQGTYLSTWRKEPGGRWKCMLEIHSPRSGGAHGGLLQTNHASLLVERLMAMWESGDTATLAELTTDDIVYDDVPNAQRLVGRESVQEYIEHVHAWAGQVRIEITALNGSENAAVAEWIMRGVQDRPIPGRVPVATNRSFELRGATMVELRDGKIARAADYMDVLGFVLQLGARVELPGGVVVPFEGSGQ